MDTVWIFSALCVASFLAGAINAIAGGGTLLTFPALLAVVSPVAANASSTVALVPGTLASAWAYRGEVAHPTRWLKWLLPPSIVGGALGTLLVTRSEERYFAAAIPWLILLAAVLFSAQPLVARKIKTPAAGQTAGTAALAGLAAMQLVVSVYGGYFGAGIGILMLSALAYMGLRDMHQMNALKTLLATGINAMSAVLFIGEGRVVWKYSLAMAVAAMAGGYLGARLSLRFPAARVRQLVTAIGYGLAAYYFYRQFA